jgi:hypothetical protein
VLYSKLLQVIATRTFSVFFLRMEYMHYEKWIVLVVQWSLIGAIIIGGPATAKIDKHGPYCENLFDLQIFTVKFHGFHDHPPDGIVGDWCWIAANYTVQRIVYEVMITKPLNNYSLCVNSLDYMVVSFRTRL